MNALPPQLCHQLRDHLDGELGVHRRLLAVAEAKTQEIVACNIPAFTQLLQQEQAPLAELGRLRQLRERLMRVVAGQLGVAAEGITMAQVLPAVPAGLQAEISRRQEELMRVLGVLREINQRNMVLIQQSLRFVHTLLHGLVGEKPERGAAYDRRGLQGMGLPGNGRLVNLRG
jgi:flagellar biosynthesis/type III secretory pathway chaperone